MDRLRNDFESKCNTITLQINALQVRVEELRQLSQKQESGLKELELRQFAVEHGKK